MCQVAGESIHGSHKYQSYWEEFYQRVQLWMWLLDPPFWLPLAPVPHIGPQPQVQCPPCTPLSKAPNAAHQGRWHQSGWTTDLTRYKTEPNAEEVLQRAMAACAEVAQHQPAMHPGDLRQCTLQTGLLCTHSLDLILIVLLSPNISTLFTCPWKDYRWGHQFSRVTAQWNGREVYGWLRLEKVQSQAYFYISFDKAILPCRMSMLWLTV